MLRVKMAFMLPAKKKNPIAEFDLSLKRSCEEGKCRCKKKNIRQNTHFVIDMEAVSTSC